MRRAKACCGGAGGMPWRTEPVAAQGASRRCARGDGRHPREMRRSCWSRKGGRDWRGSARCAGAVSAGPITNELTRGRGRGAAGAPAWGVGLGNLEFPATRRRGRRARGRSPCPGKRGATVLPNKKRRPSGVGAFRETRHPVTTVTVAPFRAWRGWRRRCRPVSLRGILVPCVRRDVKAFVFSSVLAGGCGTGRLDGTTEFAPLRPVCIFTGFREAG